MKQDSVFFLSVQSMYDVPKMRDLIKQARYARCRSRFPVPVILYEGKVTELGHLPVDFLK